MKSIVKTTLILSVLALVLVPFEIGVNVAGQGKGKRVPPNESYVVVNKKGEKTREYGPGEAMPNAVDCVQVKCPKVLKDAGKGKTVRCWRCGQD